MQITTLEGVCAISGGLDVGVLLFHNPVKSSCTVILSSVGNRNFTARNA